MLSKKSKAVVNSILKSLGPSYCVFCRRKIDEEADKLLYGPCEKNADLSVHYFCLLFSSSLTQGGPETEGIKGFLEIDIRREIRRGAGLQCTFCRKHGATIGCVNEKCRKVVHYPCGLANKMTYNFASSTFDSYCRDHNPFLENTVTHPNSICSICLIELSAEVLPEEPSKSLSCPTCRNTFHVGCLRETAWKSGIHHFRCPFCRDVEAFLLHCQQSGIYVPDQDAAWELEAAFDDHYEVLHRCNALNCLCPGGRDVDDEVWDIVSCSTCGINASHIQCRNLGEDGIYICADCTPLPPPRNNDGTDQSLNLWFYSKSRLHFQQPQEAIIRIESSQDGGVVDVDTIEEDIAEDETMSIDVVSCSSASSMEDLVLIDSSEESTDDYCKAPSPSYVWREFQIRFSRDECEAVFAHLPKMPVLQENCVEEAIETGEAPGSEQKRSPFALLQQGPVEDIMQSAETAFSENNGDIPESAARIS